MSSIVVTSRELNVTINVMPGDFSVPLSQVSTWLYECVLSEEGKDGSVTLELAQGYTPSEAVEKAFTQLGVSYFEPSWEELSE